MNKDILLFDEEKHEYTFNGKKLISVTQLMQKYGLAPCYDNVDPNVLSAKAERGTMIHSEIEQYIKFGKLGFSQELYSFIKWLKKSGAEILSCEKKVHNDVVAGTIDLVYKLRTKVYRADFKTTAEVHINSVSWQISIYDELDDIKADFYQCFHFDKYGMLEVIDVPKQPDYEVKRLIDAERKQKLFEISIVDDNSLKAVEDFALYFEEVEKKRKEYDVLLDKIKNAMEERGLKEVVRGNVKIECKGGKSPYTKNQTITNFEEEKFKTEYPVEYDIYKKYVSVETKTINVSGSPNKEKITILKK